MTTLDEALRGLAARRAGTVVAPGDVACIVYTSGTTGPSKGAVLTHRANLQLARANVELMEYTADDVLYTAFPLFHVNAKFTTIVSSMLVRCAARARRAPQRLALLGRHARARGRPRSTTWAPC